MFFLLISTLSSCKKEKDDGVMSGDLIYSNGYVNSSQYFTINEAYLYVFIDDDTDITNGFIARLTIDIINVTPGTTTISYDIDISELSSGSYYLLAAYDFGIEGQPSNTDPDNPQVWEAKGWFGSTTTSPPASANVSNLSDDYDITLKGLN
jgi:hypothetical protein